MGPAKKWTDDVLRDELERFTSEHGFFPSRSQLYRMEMGSLASGIGILGGFTVWSEKMGFRPKRKPWTDARIESALRRIIEETGDFPTKREIGGMRLTSLYEAMHRTGGAASWQERLGFEPKRMSWNDAVIEQELIPIVASLGHMPAASDLKSIGRHDLTNAISASGGFIHWARKIGAKPKPSSVTTGLRWERHEAGRMRSLGHEVEEMPPGHPFDLMVNGHRVDVKSSVWRPYTGCLGSYVFSKTKRGRDADLFDAVCVEGDEVIHRFVIPAEQVVSDGITISVTSLRGEGKYGPYLNAEHLFSAQPGGA